MTLKLVSVPILVLLCVTICHSGPPSGVAGVTPSVDPLIPHILKIEPSVLEKMVRVDYPSHAKLFADLVKCYDGDNVKAQRQVYQLCQANKDQLLDSYYANLGTSLGRSLLAPIEFLKGFKQFAQWSDNAAKSQMVNLKAYSGIWHVSGQVLEFTDSCKRMIKLVDVGFGQWGYDANTVVEFFEQKLQQPIGEALELCRKRVKVSV